MEIRDWRLEIGDWTSLQSPASSLQCSAVLRTALVAILLTAFFLRTHLLIAIPPGLTHDEANHGREAIGILQGNLALFFPLNYGSEPLYSYTVAALMALVGRGLLALRLVNVYFGLLALSATYLFGRLALGRGVALVATALMAISFWPLASSRQALRAGMMPFFAAGAMIFFWLLLKRARVSSPGRRDWVLVAGLALCLAATFYNYLAARVLWLVFPLFLAYLGFTQRGLLRRLWLPVLAALLLTALLVAPMFLYLQQHPEAQTRLQMFGVLDDLLQGSLLPLLRSAGNALLAFVWPGAGDRFLAYNLPGRPALTLPTALFFVTGLLVCLWRWRRPRYAFLLLWFLVGITPSLLTGATANTTRNVGAMPVTFLLPAVGFVTLARAAAAWRRPAARFAAALVAAAWLALALWIVSGDYFVRWGRAPEVRAAYMHTLVQQLAYVEARPSARPAIISSELPGPAHNQSIGLVLLPGALDLRWIDARHALILPARSGAAVLVPTSTPLHPAFAGWLSPVETVRLQPEDLDPAFTVYRLLTASAPPASAPPALPFDDAAASFGVDAPAATLVGSAWLTPEVRAGEAAELLQVWRVDDAAGVGPHVAAIDGTDVVLFTHVLDQAGHILAQDDRLDAPSSGWQTGDLVLQVHRLQVPAQTPAGAYRAVAGIYDRASQQPLPLLDDERRWDATRATVDLLNIIH